MKKIILTLVVAIFSAGAFAQITPQNKDRKEDIKELRKDNKEVRHDKRLRNYEFKHNNKAEAKAETKDIKADKKEMAHDVKNLKKDGVKHPLKHAHSQIHKHEAHRH